MKVGSDQASDLRRGMIIRSVIDDPANLPKDHAPRDPKTLFGKNAGPTGNVLMIDANQVNCSSYRPPKGYEWPIILI